MSSGTGAVTLNATGTKETTLSVVSNILTIGGNISGAADQTLKKTGVGTLILSGATSPFSGTAIVNAGTLQVSGALSASATVNAGVLQVFGTLSGSTTVNGGSLVVSGSGSVLGLTTVNNTGTLDGEGGSAGAVTVNSGGTLTPGVNSVGSMNTGALTFAAGGIFKFEVNSDTPALDFVSITGNLTIGSGAVMNVSDLGNTLFTVNDYIGLTAPILDYTGVWNGGTFAGFPDGSIFTIGLNAYQINYAGADVSIPSAPIPAVTLTIVAIPEPGAIVSLLGGLGLLLGVRRRRTA